MKIGIPRERKAQEYRVALDPSRVKLLTAAGHVVTVEQGAGIGAGFGDSAFREAGARIVPEAGSLWREADLVLKVKEPLSTEFPFLREGLLLFAFLHLAAHPDLARELLSRRVTAFAFETVEEEGGKLPILFPMSEIAGSLATQMGASALERVRGGKGVLLGGATGAEPGRVVVLGAGTVGTHAARVARGMGARIRVLDRDAARLARIQATVGPDVETELSTETSIAEGVARADLLVGAVHQVGARTPRLLRRGAIAAMEPGSVFVDVAIDQGGCAETSRPTTHESPTYVEEGVVHLCVANLPSAVARTSTRALSSALAPYVERLAGEGGGGALSFPPLRKGLNTRGGAVLHPSVARSLGLESGRF